MTRGWYTNKKIQRRHTNVEVVGLVDGWSWRWLLCDDALRLRRYNWCNTGHRLSQWNCSYHVSTGSFSFIYRASMCICIYINCVTKNIKSIFDCHLKTSYQISIIFGTNIHDTTCHQMTSQFPPHSLSASAIPRESRSSKIYLEITRKPEKKHLWHYQL